MFHRRISEIFLPLGLIFVALLGAYGESKSTTSADIAYQQSFEKWKAELIANRKNNWLPLVGLFWLKEGSNNFGADESNPIALPSGSTVFHAGVFILHGKQVTLEMVPDVAAQISGKPVITAPLQSDASDKPTVVELRSLRMHVIERGARIGIRVKDLNSPAAKNHKGPIFYPLNMAYRVTAQWIPSNGKQMVNVPNVLGDITPVPSAGVAVFTINGHKYRLTDLGGDANGLSFVFNDLTKKADTYPGGRFLDADPPKDGKVVLDFNRAYNPPCSVTPYATCPLAPPEDRLNVAIPAGEKYDREHAYYHHSE
jgi:uncharacterized protein